MIQQAEIQRIANSKGVRDTQIEKDYILSWILTAIANNNLLSQALAFKGGTVLKKFYFEDYRFSEDLDFTLIDNSTTNEDIQEAFGVICEYVREETNMNLSVRSFQEHTTGNINFFINYIGPLGGTGSNKDVKVDISKNELLQFNTANKQLLQSYTDHQACILKCYTLEEIMTEKMRSLLSRVQPRDYYDLWYLLENEDLNMASLRIEFEAKARHKELDPGELKDRLEIILPAFRSQWVSSMSAQIQNLPKFDTVCRAMGRHFRSLFRE